MEEGKCYICGSNVTYRTVARHVDKCMRNRIAIKGTASNDKTFLLKIKGKYTSHYFLYLLVDACVTLKELDRYLRNIWLECCGHLSCFNIKEEVYESYPDEAFNPEEEMDIEVEVGVLFYEGLSFTHKYDYGSTTTLELRVMHVYPSLEERKGITLLARNEGQDSPRDGECGYCGPSKDIPFMEHRSTDQNNKKKATRKKRNRSQATAAANLLLQGTSRLNKKNEENRLYEKFKNATPDEKLDLFEEIFSSNYPGEDSVRILTEALEKLKSLTYNKKYQWSSLAANSSKLTDLSLYDILKALKKSELTAIGKNLLLNKTSSFTKDKLATAINEFIHTNIEDILLYMPSGEFKLFQYMLNDNEINSDKDIDVILESDAIKSGLLFEIENEYGYCSFQVPTDIKVKIENLINSERFIKKRDFNTKLEQSISIILFYWGIVEKHDLLKEVSKQISVEISDSFQSACIKLFRCLSGKTIQVQKVGSLEFFSILTEDVRTVVLSDSWRNSVYPQLTKETFKHSDYNTLHRMVDNPYFKAFFEEIKDNENLYIDDDEYYEDNVDVEYDAMKILVNVYACVFNASPGMKAGEFLNKIKTDNYTENPIVTALEREELIEKMLAYTPNIWLKGNSPSGEIHSLINGSKPYMIGKKLKSKPYNTSVKVAEKWVAGRNDPCPCGSGKKYKKCCLI